MSRDGACQADERTQGHGLHVLAEHRRFGRMKSSIWRIHRALSPSHRAMLMIGASFVAPFCMFGLGSRRVASASQGTTRRPRRAFAKKATV